MNQEQHNLESSSDRVRELRARLLTQTTAVVRRRRHFRRAGIAAACCGCYVAGLLTVGLLSGGVPSPAAPKAFVKKTAKPAGGAGNNHVVETAGDAQHAQLAQHASLADSPALAPKLPLTVRPVQKEKSRFVTLRELGDRYLLEEQDPAGAARCYQMALRFATEEEVNQHPDEGTWLFRALKLDHKWEADHARNQG